MSLSDLEQFRDHARRMSDWRPRLSTRCAKGAHLGSDVWDTCHGQTVLGGPDCECECHPNAPTPPTAAEVDLWDRLAGEVDDYLNAGYGDEGLWDE